MTRETTNRGALIERYRELLPVTSETPIISLKEGGTPLLRARAVEKECARLAGRELDLAVWLKFDGGAAATP